MRSARLLVLAAIIAGCGGGSGGGTTGPTPVFTSVQLVSSSMTAYQFGGTDAVFTVTAIDQNGHTMSSGGAVPVFNVSPGGIATVNGSNTLVVSSGTPTLLTVTADLTIASVTKSSGQVQIQTDLAPLSDNVIAGAASYSPVTVHIVSGGTVNWSGLSTAGTHNVHFATITPFAGGTQAISGLPGTVNTATVSLSTPGSYDYQCDIHGPAMHGTIVVH
jgi:plastocyanin